MESKKMIVDIQCLINEHYSDKEPLNESQQKSKKVFNDYCEQIKKDLEKYDALYNKIKEKRDNAQKDLHKDIVADKIKEVKEEVIGQIAAYNDVLSLMESMKIDE